MTQPMVEAGRKTGTSKPPTAGFRFMEDGLSASGSTRRSHPTPHIVNAVHREAHRIFGSPVPIMEFPASPAWQFLLAPAFRPLPAASARQGTASRRSNPTCGFGSSPAALRRNRRAPPVAPSPRASDRARTYTTPAAGRARPTDSRSTACKRRYYASQMRSRLQPDDRRPGPHEQSAQRPWLRRRAAPAETPHRSRLWRRCARRYAGRSWSRAPRRCGRGRSFDIAFSIKRVSSAETRSSISDDADRSS